MLRNHRFSFEWSNTINNESHWVLNVKLLNIFTLVLLFRITITVHTGHNVLTSPIRTLRHATSKKLIPSHTASKGTKPRLQSRPIWPSKACSDLHTWVSKALWQVKNTVQTEDIHVSHYIVFLILNHFNTPNGNPKKNGSNPSIHWMKGWAKRAMSVQWDIIPPQRGKKFWHVLWHRGTLNTLW